MDFQTAGSKFQSLRESGKPTVDEMLKAYALFNQANTGDVAVPAPADPTDSVKWSAWNGLKGMSTDEAKKRAIDLVASIESR
ncbi:hypothetical protein HK101_003468 [Irineochytrium annulatum]|nr:hypothetical protein HK101_003468 [Irineochytrium annulatum]